MGGRRGGTGSPARKGSSSQDRRGAEHTEPKLGALATITGPQPEDVAGALDGDREGDVDPPVGDLAVADLGSVADCVIWTVLQTTETT